MTRMQGVARDPESGAAVKNRQVTAVLWPIGSRVAPIADGLDVTYTDNYGAWELRLPPTGVYVAVKVRVWRAQTLYARVPEPPLDDSPVDILDWLVDPEDLDPIGDGTIPPFVTRSELNQPDGPATLDQDGLLKESQDRGPNMLDVQAAIDDTVGVHIADLTPHAAYDDIPTLRLLFENGLV